MKPLSKFTAVVFVCVTTLGSAVKGETVDNAPEPVLALPQLAKPHPITPAIAEPTRRYQRTSRTLSLSDRCRAVTEYAQLGEIEDAGLELLRHSCG